MCVALAGSATGAEIKALAKNEATSLSDGQTDSLPIKIPAVDGQDIRFRRLSKSAGLSQTRVASVVQDKLGFIWFGTQYGLNRYDGYTSKVFKHEPGHSDSLSCVYIRSLFVDHSGTLWVGCDRFLDKYEPITKTFTHYPIDTQVLGSLPTPIERINEDDPGMLLFLPGRIALAPAPADASPKSRRTVPQSAPAHKTASRKTRCGAGRPPARANAPVGPPSFCSATVSFMPPLCDLIQPLRNTGSQVAYLVPIGHSKQIARRNAVLFAVCKTCRCPARPKGRTSLISIRLSIRSNRRNSVPGELRAAPQNAVPLSRALNKRRGAWPRLP
jgi:hypothetical protein